MDCGRGKIEVLLAVKHLQYAKTRLEPALPDQVRRATVLAMLADTISVCQQVSTIASVTVVTPDAAVAATARRGGAKVLPEPSCYVHSDPLNVALRAGEAAIIRGRDRATVNIAVLQPDLGALKPQELRDATHTAGKMGRSFIPDQDGYGTTALFAFGVDLGPKFGDGSARRHLLSGASQLDGLWPGMRQDIDTTTDLEAACRLGLNPETCAALEQRCAVGPYSTRAGQTLGRRHIQRLGGDARC